MFKKAQIPARPAPPTIEEMVKDLETFSMSLEGLINIQADSLDEEWLAIENFVIQLNNLKTSCNKLKEYEENLIQIENEIDTSCIDIKTQAANALN
uniref:Putative secreted protein n=1 Tax=Xenopsylla cheopis TaxID=163159 RepID=A0A6M2DKP8_XENCH